MNRTAWISFWILGFIWGSSFLLIRIGVEDIPATQLVLVRTTVAAIGLNLVRHFRGFRLPTDWSTIRAFTLIGVGNAAIPYTLISLGEQNISSGNAAVLQATASLFTLIVAHFAFTDERITPRKIAGLAVGFAGIVLLSSRNFDSSGLDTPALLGQLAVMGASLFYATFIVYSRKVIGRNLAPIVVSSGTFIPAAIVSFFFMLLEPVFGGRAFVPFTELPTDSLLAVFGLGFFNTFIAYLFFYFIIRELGAFRASMVTYIVPAVGLFLGWVVLGEETDARLLLGAALIFMGIGIVNIRHLRLRRQTLQFRRAATTTTGT